MQLTLDLELTSAALTVVLADTGAPAGIGIDLANYAVNSDGSHDFDYPSGDKP